MGCLASGQHLRQLLAHLPSISEITPPYAHGAGTLSNRPCGPARWSPPNQLSKWPGNPSDIHGPFQGHCSKQLRLEGLRPTAPLLNTHTHGC